MLLRLIASPHSGEDTNVCDGRGEPILVAELTYIGHDADLYETVALASSPLFSVLRYRTPSSPICLSEVIRQALRLIASIPLIQRREKHRSREEKSAFT